MKFKFFALLAFISLLTFSCSKNEDVATLSGTKWTASYVDNILVVEFTSKTNYQEYMADAQGNVSSTGVDYGTYTFDGASVIFNCNYVNNRIKSAAINGNVMDLTYESGYKRTFLKK